MSDSSDKSEARDASLSPEGSVETREPAEAERETAAEPADTAPAEAEREAEAEAEKSSEPAAAEPAKAKAKSGGGAAAFWRFILDVYATADPRSLGLFRIALGTLLFVDVARRWPDIAAHYSNDGWLTNHFALFRPMSSHLFSAYLAFSTTEEVKFFLCLHLLVNFLLIIGWHTKLMQVLAAILIVSISNRNIMIENGGWVVLNLLTVWSMFLPLGKRFSVDALLASLRRRREMSAETLNQPLDPPRDTTPVRSLAITALIAQWTVIYYFNVVHKNGPQWRDGTAVYYFFQQDRMVTDFGAWIRDQLPLWAIKGMTWSTLVIESLVAILLVLPVRSPYVRMVAWALVIALHGSIDAVVQLGPFSWCMIVMFFALIPAQFWGFAKEWLRRRRTRCELYFDANNATFIGFCRFVKRLDVLDLIRFVPFSSKDSGETAAATADDSPLAKLERRRERTLVVTVPGKKRPYTGVDALLALSRAMPLGSLPLFWVRIPPFKGWVKRRLERWVKRRQELDRHLEIEGHLAAGEYRAEEPSPLRKRLDTVRFWAGQAAVAVVIVACGSQVLIENRAVPEKFKPHNRPEWMTAIVIYPRLFQGWSMFAPGPPTDDGRVVIDGRTKDGRKLDPFTGQAPSFEVQPKGGFRMNQIWGDFHRRIAEDRFRVYWGGVKDMILNYHRITGRPADEIVAFDAWFVNEVIPPPGQPKLPPTKRKLFSHGKVD